jgi:Nitrile hydratase, alpha chain
MEMNRDAQQAARIYGRIVAKAWEDEAFKQKLMASPAAVLQEYGIEVLPGVDVKVVEGRGEPEVGPSMIVLPLPPRPSSDELSTEELEQAAGGTHRLYNAEKAAAEPIKSGTTYNSYTITYT